MTGLKRKMGFSGLIIGGILLASTFSAAAATYTVSLGGFSFTPNDVALAPGDTVHFVWSSGFHTATSGTSCTPDTTYFDQPLDPSHLTFDFVVPTGPAQIPFFCRFHCSLGMVGTLRIFHLGDLNCDGAVNFNDINPFVTALSDPAGYAQQFPTCNINLGDINRDGQVNFSDINPFVALLTGQ